MKHRSLGSSRLQVSAIGHAVMTIGGQTSQDDAMCQHDMAHNAGINLFDTAENYSISIGDKTQGRSEKVLGHWLAEKRVRDRVIGATKVVPIQATHNASSDLASEGNLREETGLQAYSPLARGTLTGKYRTSKVGYPGHITDPNRQLRGKDAFAPAPPRHPDLWRDRGGP